MPMGMWALFAGSFRRQLPAFCACSMSYSLPVTVSIASTK